MGDKPAAATGRWVGTIQVALTILAAAGTALGAWGTYQSGLNKGRIDDLTAQIQATQQFAAGIHDARDVLTTDQHVKAMVELSRLYALARTPEQKLVLIQVAQLSQQWQGLEAMATLIGNDDQMQASKSEADRKVLASIDRIIAKAQTQIAQQTATAAVPAMSATKAAASPPKRTGAPHATSKPVAHTSEKPPFPQPHPVLAAETAKSADAPLTQSANAAVAASAALIAALPKTAKQRGWIFLGDVAGGGAPGKAAGAPILPQSATTSAHAVPKPGASIAACHDVNLRDVPLGKLLTIVSQGTTMQVLTPDSAIPSAFGATSAFTHRPITARWAFVEVEATNQDAPSGCS